MNLPDEKVEAVLALIREQRKPRPRCRDCADMLTGRCQDDPNRERCDPDEALADALAPLLAGWLAEAWDQALGHVWDLADPAYSVVMTQASKYVIVEADIIQAQRENPYRAALDADAEESQ